MSSRTPSRGLWRPALVAAAVAVSAANAGGTELQNPDFTRGDVLPKDAPHDWNLGPTGLRGWMYCDELVTADARQIAITAVDPGSPADGLIAVGDVLLGIGGKAFAFDPRTELGRAITAAETVAGEPDFPPILSKKKAADVRKAIAKVEAAQEEPALKSMNEQQVGGT